jgi:hypothetical protein
MKKNKRAIVDVLDYAKQYPLWPDEKGLLSLPAHRSARSSAALSSRSRTLPGPGKISQLHLPRTRSLFLWLLEKSTTISTFGNGKQLHIARWLSLQLEDADFGALEINRVVELGVDQLALDRENMLRILITLTRWQSDFKSDGQLITFR